MTLNPAAVRLFSFLASQAACGLDDPRLVDLKKSLAAMWQKGAVDSGESFI